MPPAARLTDMHVCPMQTPAVVPIPHVGGPITGPGAPNVLIGGLPAAVVGDMAVCVGPPDVIVKGSMTVLISGRPAARMGDMTAHGGVIMGGFPTVMIGEVGGGGGAGGMGVAGRSAQGATMRKAKASGAAFAEMNCATKTVVASLGDHPALKQPPKDAEHPAWIEIALVDQAGDPVKHARYRVEGPDGTPYEGWTDGDGIARVDGLKEGTCKISLPDLDAASWKKA